MKTWLITGANRGIGLGLVRHLLRETQFVIATARSPDEATELQELAATHAGTLSIEPLDVTSAESVGDLAARLGAHTIDFLVNNAGIMREADDTFRECSLDHMADMMLINAVGAARVIDALLPCIEIADDPVIVNMSSSLGSITANTDGGAHGYRMSKAAMNMLTKTLSVEFPDIVTVSMHPGWVRTDMGGQNASLSIDDSVSGILKVVQGLSIKDTGRFLSYEGKELPW